MIDFTTLKSRFMDATGSAKRTAEDIVEVTKMRMQVSQFKSELAKAYEKLGGMVYNMMKEDEQDSGAVNVCIDEIDYILEKIQEAEGKIKELRKVSCCQSCGAEVPADAIYCPKCGAKIERPEPVVSEECEAEEVQTEQETEACEECAEAPEVPETPEAPEAAEPQEQEEPCEPEQAAQE